MSKGQKNELALPLQVFSKQHKRAKNLAISGEDTFLNGKVHEIMYQDANSSENKQGFVILIDNHEKTAVDTRTLILQLNTIADEKLKNTTPSILSKLTNLSGWISLILVCAIVYIGVFRESQDVPEFLKTAFLTIIGFYFGGLAQEKNKS